MDSCSEPVAGDTRFVRAEPSRTMKVGPRTCWALAAVMSSVVLALSAGVGPPLSVDTWAFIILAIPALSVTVAALAVPIAGTPSSVLMSRRGAKGSAQVMWRWFVAPYAVPLLTPVCLLVSEYVGSGLSFLQTPPQGLGPLLFASPELGWYLPLVGMLFGVLLGWVGIMAVAVPLRALIQVPRLWDSDRPEALGQVAYCGVVFGLELTIFAHAPAFWAVSDADTSRLQVLGDELDLLVGGTQAGSPMWTRLLAWAGVMSLSVAGAIIWRTARASRD